MRKIQSLVALALLGLCIHSGLAEPMVAMGLEIDSVGRRWEDNAFFARMTERTGVAVRGTAVEGREAWKKALEAMARGEISADVLLKAELSRSEEARLLEAGALIDLAPYLEAYMPNLSRLLAEHPAWREAISLPDGRIASLPAINPQERQAAIWINRDWLEALGIEMPESPDALTAALLAMGEGDPNGNGKRDEIPADLLGVWEMRWLLPYFGIVADDWNLARDASGALVFAPEMPGYRDFVALLRQWTSSGILPEEAFRSLHATSELAAQSEASGGLFGGQTPKKPTIVSGLFLSMSPVSRVPVEASGQYAALLMQAGEDTLWRDLLGSVSTGALALTRRCSDIGAALRWADALYAEDAILAYAGAEGEDWAWDAQGNWHFLLGGARTIESIRRDTILYTGAVMPGLYPYDFLARVDSPEDRAVEAEQDRVRAVAQRVTPPYALSGEAAERAAAIQRTLGAKVDEGIARFATGEVPLDDESWNAWLAALREAGSAELVALFAGR